VNVWEACFGSTTERPHERFDHTGIERELKVAGANKARPLVVHWDRYLYDGTAGHRTLMRYLVLFAVVGLLLAALGAMVGMVGAILGTRLLRAFLFGVTPQDPLTLIGVALLLIAVALLACWWPAQRAARVDPLEALRCE
jgi:hypothetical protein